jgi:hypothetical protein
VQYLQQLIQTDRHGEGNSSRLSAFRDQRAGNEFIAVVMFVITASAAVTAELRVLLS